jgi:hypothetical protein
LRLRILVLRSAWMTSSAKSSGTSTSEKRSEISIAPMASPLMPASLAIAPTRSPGRRPSMRPEPMNRRTVSEAVVARAPPARSFRAGRPIEALARQGARSLGRRGLEHDVRAPRPGRRLGVAGLVRELQRGGGHVHRVELAGELGHDARKASRPPASTASRTEMRVMLEPRWRRSATLGSVASSSFCCVAC